MANRYDGDPDDYGFGRRDGRGYARDDDEQRMGRYAQGRPGEGRFAESRPGPRQNGWRERHERERQERLEADFRARAEQEYHRNQGWRGSDYGDNNYYSGREAWDRDNYALGRGSSIGDREPRESRGWGSHERGRGWHGGGQPGWHGGGQRGGWHHDPQRRDRQSVDRGNYRGLYQEQVWTRDPASGHLYGYEYSTPIDQRRFNAGDESQDRWRADVHEQNRRYDIDRGWPTAGTSGYGNAGAYPSQYGRGPKGYVRSDERIREDVCDRLSDDDEIDARDITVTVKGGEVILEGTAIDRRTKHRAEDVAESVSGVKEVTNHLRARKGLLQELGDRVSGDDELEHHGHRGSGTRNSPLIGSSPSQQKTAH